uniref:Myosin light chain kinase 2 n=1 Tax=Bubo bubo TaxID=30461 RepID=A0A8C0FLU5_BUBBB
MRGGGSTGARGQSRDLGNRRWDGGDGVAACAGHPPGTQPPTGPLGGKAEAVGEMTPTTPEPQDGAKAASAAWHDGGQAASTEKVPAAAKPQGGGKDEPGKEKTPLAGEPKVGKAAPVEGKALAAAKPQGGGKDEPGKEQALGGLEAERGGKAKPTEKTALAAAQAQDGGKDPAKEKTTTAAKAQDGGKKAATTEKTPTDKKPVKEKAPAAAKAQDGENKVAKAEKASAAKKAQDGGKEEPAKEKAAAPTKEKAEKTPADKKPVKEKAPAAAKEKAPATVKAQDGENKVAKAEKAPAAKKAQDGGKEEPVKEKAAAPAKEKAPDAAKAEDGEKAKATKAEKTLAAKKPQDRSKEEPAKEKAPAAAKVLDGGKKAVKVEKTTAASKAEGGGKEEPTKEKVPATAKEKVPGAVKAQDGGKKAAKVESPPAAAEAGPGGSDPPLRADDVPPPPAPFTHRIVTLHSASVSSQFNLSSKEILGGGKFGEVHTCTEKQTGLKLAAKVIRKQGAKEKEMVLLEIDVMNQLNHRNLIQLYDAIETPREIILFMEFISSRHGCLEGGDDPGPSHAATFPPVHFGATVSLSPQPENILCVAATGHMVKIIDFGLARRYNPQEKLKVNFGTPEFLSPEVVNYEQVSYSTDMWSMGVITYMLLSGLSPFLGDNDTETLNNVLAANWYFDEETFESVSDEAKDFVSNLIIKEKSARMSAGQCLQHPWLNNLAEKAKRCNRRLKSQVLLKKYVMRRRWKVRGTGAGRRVKGSPTPGSLRGCPQGGTPIEHGGGLP